MSMGYTQSNVSCLKDISEDAKSEKCIFRVSVTAFNK
jgi:hypothetical protein